MFEYVWCGSSVLPVDLSACMRLKHNLVWGCEDRLWIVQSIREIDGCSLSSCWELHCTCKETRSCCAFRLHSEVTWKNCRIRVRCESGSPEKTGIHPVQKIWIWHDVTADRIVAYTTHMNNATSHRLEMWLTSLTKTRDLSGSWASLFPASSRRFNHRNKKCVYFSGVKQCKVHISATEAKSRDLKIWYRYVYIYICWQRMWTSYPSELGQQN